MGRTRRGTPAPPLETPVGWKKHTNESLRRATKQKRAPKKDMLKKFGGSHAKVLAHYMKLGRFKVAINYHDDSLCVFPRSRSASCKKLHPGTVKTFCARFGHHFRELGFSYTDRYACGTLRIAYEYKSYSKKPLELTTLEPRRDDKQVD
jgi:hypothetical protein